MRLAKSRHPRTLVLARPSTRAAKTVGRLLGESDDAEDAVAVVVRSGGEEELVVSAVGAAVMTELNAPETIYFDWLAAGVAQRAKESARASIKEIGRAHV